MFYIIYLLRISIVYLLEIFTEEHIGPFQRPSSGEDGVSTGLRLVLGGDALLLLARSIPGLTSSFYRRNFAGVCRAYSWSTDFCSGSPAICKLQRSDWSPSCQLVAQYLLVYVVWFIQLQVLCIIFSLLKFIAMCKTFDCFCKELDVERKNSPRSSY